MLLDRGARVIVAAHLDSDKKSLAAIGGYLAQVLGAEIRLPEEVVGDSVTKLVTDTRAGQVVLLENLRQHPGEAEGNADLARSLAALCDAYVNDALSGSRLAWASVVDVVGKVPEHQCAAGEHLSTMVQAFSTGRDRSFPTVYLLEVPDSEHTFRGLALLAAALKSGDTLYLSGLGGIAIGQSLEHPNLRPRAWER